MPTQFPDVVISHDLIRAARLAAGLSREEAAAQVGRSYPSIAAYESGLANPPAAVLVRLAAVYRCKVEDFCTTGDLAAAS